MQQFGKTTLPIYHYKLDEYLTPLADFSSEQRIRLITPPCRLIEESKDAIVCPGALLPEEPFRPCNSQSSPLDLPKRPSLHLLKQILHPSSRRWILRLDHHSSAMQLGGRYPPALLARPPTSPNPLARRSIPLSRP